MPCCESPIRAKCVDCAYVASRNAKDNPADTLSLGRESLDAGTMKIFAVASGEMVESSKTFSQAAELQNKAIT